MSIEYHVEVVRAGITHSRGCVHGSDPDPKAVAALAFLTLPNGFTAPITAGFDEQVLSTVGKKRWWLFGPTRCVTEIGVRCRGCGAYKRATVKEWV